MSHYFSEEQDSRLKLKKIIITIGPDKIEMMSGSGVFSKDALDKGTALLAKNILAKDHEQERVLDLGCGIGIIGIYAKMKFPKTDVWLSDVNKRAVMLAEKNLALQRLDGKAVHSDGFANIKGDFDLVLLNPPQVAGKEVCFRLISESFGHLKNDGLLELVARHNKGGRSYSEEMLRLFGNMRDIAKDSGYRVYVSQKRNQRA